MTSPEQQELRDRFFKVLLEAAVPLEPGPEGSTWSIGMPRTTFPFPPGPSHQATLEALIDASQMLTNHLRVKLDGLRRQQDEWLPGHGPSLSG
jgi:hypothetical protein